jgi:hypothetical protein
MAATGFTPVSLYYSATASNVPLAANLVAGELAMNTNDGKLFYKDSAGVVQTMASKGTGSIGGATTQVQFNNAGVLGGSASLTWSGTVLTSSGFAGPLNGTVGATTPATGAFTTVSASGVATFSAGTVSLPAITTSGDTNTGIYFPAADTIAFTEGGAEAMRIDSSGNVGVGTSSPDAGYQLDVGNKGRVRLNPSTGTNAVYLNANNTGGSFYIGRENSAGSDFATTAYSSVLYSTGAYPMSFWTNATERMRIDSSGNVGIGTSSPAVKLDVAGNATVQNGVLTVGKDTVYDAFINTPESMYFNVDSDANSTGNRFVWGTDRAGTSGGTEWMRLDSAGNLGLGVTPSAWRTNSGERAIQIGGNYPATLHADGGGYFDIGSNYYLNSSGNFIYTASGSATRYYMAGGGATSAHVWQVSSSGTAGNAITFTQAMTLDASGNLGIGTSSPSSFDGSARRLVVGDGSANQGISIYGSSTANLFFAKGTTGTDPYVGFINYTFATNVMAFNTNAAERMRIDSSGNLLVGTTTASGYGNHELRASQTGAGNGAVVAYNSSSSDNATGLNVLKGSATTSSSARFVQFYANNGGTAMGGIVGNGASNAQFSAISDAREKTNIQLISGSLNKILALKPSSFDWIATNEHTPAGFIAQEVQTIFPEFVVENMSNEGQEQRYGLTGGMTGGIIPHLVKAIQEQQALIQDLTTRLAKLEAK